MSTTHTGPSEIEQLPLSTSRAPRAQPRRTHQHPHTKIAPPVGAVRHIGLDVHAATTTVAIAEPAGGEVRLYGTIPTTPEALRRVMTKLTAAGHSLAVVYEAGPCGYWLWRYCTTLDIPCTVVAPNLIPRTASVRIKTDTRDALQLARLARAGELTPVWVPDAGHEALRDLIRAREDAIGDRIRARHRLTKFLLRHGIRRPDGINAWTTRHHHWLAYHVSHAPALQHPAHMLTLQEYLHEVDRLDERLGRYATAIAQVVATDLAPAQQAVIHALQALRGVQLLTAATVVSEVGQLARFRRPAQLMSYAGLVPREHSSGTSIHRGRITKTGNAHLRRVLVEAAWSYRHAPRLTPVVRRRHAGQSEQVKAIAWAAQLRLTARYRVLQSHGHPRPHVVTAIARELLGFVWAIGVEVERERLERAALLSDAVGTALVGSDA